MNILNRFFKSVNKKQAISWAFFDFANSSYALLIISFVFPLYFKDVIAGPALGDFYWGLVTSVSILLGAVAAPVIGAIADYDAKRKQKFIIFTCAAALGTGALYFTGSNTLLFASAIFIATNVFYELAVVLYDSFLVQVATPETRGRISGLGWGLGYLGGIIAMLLLQPLFGGGFGGDLDSLYRLTFPLVGVFFIVFSLPAFFFIKERPRTTAAVPFFKLVRIGVTNTLNTIRNIRQHKTIAWFFLGFYFINDALVTLFAFIPLYASDTIGLDIGEILILLLIVQLIGFPSAIFFGYLSDKRGSKKILLLTIVIWAGIVIALTLITTKIGFYIIAACTGLVIGSSQAVARSWLSKLIPKGKESEFFGFNGFASKVSATTGPVLFGTVSVLATQRVAMLVLLPFFGLAFLIFWRINDHA